MASRFGDCPIAMIDIAVNGGINKGHVFKTWRDRNGHLGRKCRCGMAQVLLNRAAWLNGAIPEWRTVEKPGVKK